MNPEPDNETNKPTPTGALVPSDVPDTTQPDAPVSDAASSSIETELSETPSVSGQEVPEPEKTSGIEGADVILEESPETVAEASSDETESPDNADDLSVAPPVVEAEPLSVPSRPPVPPVFFVWHPQMNEEREDNEVLPSERWRESYHLLEVTGALHWREVKTYTPDLQLGRTEALLHYHTKEYCQSMMAVSEGRASLWSNDAMFHVPTLAHTATTAGQSVAAARSAIKVALRHPKVRVMTLAGQQSRAHRNHLEDGHMFNDVLMALADAQTAGVKTAFINLDAEHPYPVQERFYTEPLLTISLHEHPSFLYPHTGTVRETGKGKGAGYHLNLPMPPSVSDAGYQLAMEQLILPLLHRYQPELLVVVGGVTAHTDDPASHLSLTSKGYQHLITTLMDVSPRLVLFGGDATHFATAARLSAIALATLAERTNSLPPQIPAAHARLWQGGTFHDTEPPLRSAPYQEYTYALLAHELEQAHQVLQGHWDLPDLTLPTRLSDQREQLQIARSNGESIANYTSKEPSLGMTFAGLSASLGDDEDDDEVASRRKPRPVSRSVPKWEEALNKDTASKPERPRGGRDESPTSNPLGNQNRRASDGGGRRERQNNSSAPEGRGESGASALPRGRNVKRDKDIPFEKQGREKAPRGNRRGRNPSGSSRASLSRQDDSATSNENSSHSATPPRGSVRRNEDQSHSASRPLRQRRKGGRDRGETPASPDAPSETNKDTSSSRPSRRHRPRSRR